MTADGLALQGERVSLATDLPNAVATVPGRSDSPSRMRSPPEGTSRAALQTASVRGEIDAITAAVGTG